MDMCIDVDKLISDLTPPTQVGRKIYFDIIQIKMHRKVQTIFKSRNKCIEIINNN